MSTKLSQPVCACRLAIIEHFCAVFIFVVNEDYRGFPKWCLCVCVLLDNEPGLPDIWPRLPYIWQRLSDIWPGLPNTFGYFWQFGVFLYIFANFGHLPILVTFGILGGFANFAHSWQLMFFFGNF